MTDADWVKVIDVGIRGAIGGAGLMIIVFIVRAFKKRKANDS